MDKLLEIIHSSEFGESGGMIDLARARMEGDVLILSFNLISDSVDEQDQAWEVECASVLDHSLTLGNCPEFSLHDDHPLLWQHIHPECSVSFHGDASNAEAVVGDLYNRHIKLVGHWIPFKSVLNGNPVDMVRGRYGMFAQGPKPLMEAYATVFESVGIKAGVSEARHHWLPADPFTSSGEIEVLVLADRSYVVAQKFNANRSEDQWNS
ncbi:MAG TPA: hypothetical protein VLA93_08340 [Pyrinomonadaceae bacterium]|nr:hypothetical protein [Pyrinomonadaceae bacterium]